MNVLFLDFRLAFRRLWRRPVVAGIAITVLATGIGCAVAAATVIDSLLFRPPPGVAEPDELSSLRVKEDPTRSAPRSLFRLGEFALVAETMSEFGSAAAATAIDSVSVLSVAPSEPEQFSPARRQSVSANYFSILGVRPAKGRFFRPEESDVHGGEAVAVLGDHVWRRLGQPELGSLVRVEEQEFTLIGVAPQKFGGLDIPGADLWVPLGGSGEDRVGYYYRVIARFPTRDRVVAATANTRTALFSGRPRASERGANVEWRPVTSASWNGSPSRLLYSGLIGGVSTAILLLCGLNAAFLLLLVGIQSSSDVRVQAALGATNARLMLQRFIESALVIIPAGVLGLGIAVWGRRLAIGLLVPELAATASLFDLRLVRQGLLIVAAALVLGAALPVFFTGRSGAVGYSAGGIARLTIPARRAQSMLVQVQVALVVMVVAIGGLFVQSLSRSLGAALGVDARGLVVVETVPFEVRRERNVPPVRPDQLRALLDGVSSVPGVQAVAAGSSLPLGTFNVIPVSLPNAELAPASSDLGSPRVSAVTPDFFTVAGMTVVRGRPLLSSDDAGAPPVTVVSETMARLIWPGQDALGECLGVGAPDFVCHRVVGVVRDPPGARLQEDPAPEYYVSALQHSELMDWPYLLVRAAGGREAQVAEALRGVVAPALPDVKAKVSPFRSLMAPQIRPWQLASEITGAVGMAALLLATGGLYAVARLLVELRAQEFAVRLALGATGASISALVLWKGFRTALVGAIAGVAIAFIIAPSLAPLLFRTSPHEPAAYVAGALVALIVVAAGATGPARAAGRTDIRRALQAD